VPITVYRPRARPRARLIEPLHSAMPLPTYLFVVRKNRKTGRCETRQINVFAHSIGADFLEAMGGEGAEGLIG